MPWHWNDFIWRETIRKCLKGIYREFLVLFVKMSWVLMFVMDHILCKSIFLFILWWNCLVYCYNVRSKVIGFIDVSNCCGTVQQKKVLRTKNARKMISAKKFANVSNCSVVIRKLPAMKKMVVYQRLEWNHDSDNSRITRTCDFFEDFPTFSERIVTSLKDELAFSKSSKDHIQKLSSNCSDWVPLNLGLWLVLFMEIHGTSLNLLNRVESFTKPPGKLAHLHWNSGGAHKSLYIVHGSPKLAFGNFSQPSQMLMIH